MTRGLDQSSIRAHAIHRVGEVLRQHRKNLVGRQANGVGELLDKRIAERITDLLGADWQVGSIAEPGSDLAAETPNGPLLAKYFLIEIIITAIRANCRGFSLAREV